MDLLTGNVKKIYLRYLGAAIGSSLITSIYSTVDTIACGQYEGPNGSAALAAVQSLWTVMVCLGILFGVGGGIMMSTARGKGEKEEGDQYFSVAVTVAAALSLVITAVFFFCREWILSMSGADEVILPYAMKYSKWIVAVVPFFLLHILLGDFVRNDGAPMVPTISTVVGGVCNMIGDYLFVFVFDLGIEGAGMATALGQLISFCILLSYFFRKRCTIRFCWPKDAFLRLKQIVAAGIAPCIVDFSFGVTVVLFNNQIRAYAGNDELAVYGAVSNMAILVQALFYGVGRSLQPLASTNTGAGNAARVKETLTCGVVTAFAMGGLFFAVAELFPLPILRMYMDVTDSVLHIGAGIVRVYAVSFLLMGLNVVFSYYFQAVMQQNISLTISLLRGLLLSVLFILLLPPLLGFDSIWWSMPLTELFTAAVGVFLLKKQKKMKTAA